VPLEVSIGIHSGPAGVGWAGPALLHCSDLADAAEAGQIFVSQTTAGLLEQENLARLTVRDLGTVRTRRSDKPVRVYELLDAPQQQV
jgi:class 3 adenylate cyclase